MRSQCMSAMLAGVGIVWFVAGANAAEESITPDAAAVESLTAFIADGGSSSHAARRAALEAMPLERIGAAHRRQVEQCLRDTTLYRHLPTKTFCCDADLLAFSLHKPEAIVDIWRILGISRLTLDPAGPEQWRLSDGYGTVGGLRLVYREHHGQAGLLVFHGRGAYTGPLAPRMLSGSCVLLVRYAAAGMAAGGREQQTIEVDAFVDMDGTGLEIVTRTLQPLIVRSAAANLHEICLFMSSLSQAAETNPEGVVRLVSRLPRTEPADKESLAGIARAAGRGRVRTAAATSEEQVQTELAARWLPQRQ
jgi:hypothetical protein